MYDVMNEGSCSLCPYCKENEEHECSRCTHPVFSRELGGMKWINGNMIELKDGGKFLENSKGHPPDWCPLRIDSQDITPDMPPYSMG